MSEASLARVTGHEDSEAMTPEAKKTIWGAFIGFFYGEVGDQCAIGARVADRDAEVFQPKTQNRIEVRKNNQPGIRCVHANLAGQAQHDEGGQAASDLPQPGVELGPGGLGGRRKLTAERGGTRMIHS